MNPTTLSSLAVLLLASGSTLAQTTYIRGVPWFNPTGTSAAPYSCVAAAECAAATNTTLSFSGGTFYETMLLDKPLTVTATTPALIGAPVTDTTTLKVLSFNTHLFGNASVFLPIWEDGARATFTGQYLNQLRLQGLDIVGLQELWDSDLYAAVAGNSLFGSFAYGGNTQSGSTLNSGLGILSAHFLQSPTQVFYNAEGGNDASASKGFLRAIITKNGFNIVFYDTHTQAGDSSGNQSDRNLQMQQLATDISIMRSLHPDYAVIAVGDFNVDGSNSGFNEYTTTMSTQMGSLGATADIAQNLACLGNLNHCTSCNNNELKIFFNNADGGSGGARLDYVLYVGSRDGTVSVVPKVYEWRRPLAPTTMSGTGWAPENGGLRSLSSRMLSDHDAIYAELELVRH